MKTIWLNHLCPSVYFQLKRELTARAAGLEFISAKELQRQYPGQSADDTESEDSVSEDDGSDENSHDDESNTDEYDSDEDDTGNDSQEDDNGRESRTNPSKIKNFRNEKIKEMLADPVRKGTEIFLKNLQLKESVASVYFDKISLAIHCERCKGTSEFLASAGRTNMVQCAQCGQTQLATYRPALVHNFSAVLGYLDLDACLPFDLILQNCSTIVSCLNCSKETKLGVSKMESCIYQLSQMFQQTVFSGIDIVIIWRGVGWWTGTSKYIYLN